MTSGIEGLDQILAGGLIEGASYIIQGQPGAGKTVLSNQIAFEHMLGGGRVLYVTLLSESHERLFQALDTMAYFDRDKLGKEIIYVSVFQTLRDDGLSEVVKLLRGEIQRHRATMLVFDGLLNARDRAATDFDVKSFVAEVQGQAAFVGCTVLFLTSSNVKKISPEHTMVDGVIELTESLVGVRAVRYVQIRKSRGSGSLGGLHKFTITDEGVTVYPRLEILRGRCSGTDQPSDGKTCSGLPALDTLLHGGLPRASVTLVAGPTGSGKTTLGLHFLSQSSAEEPGLHFGFFETPARLRSKADTLGIRLPEDGDQALTTAWMSLTGNILDKLAYKLLGQVRSLGIKRVFIDGLGGFERAAVYPPRLPEFFSTLMDQLRMEGVTVLATWEMREMAGGEIRAPMSDMSAILDNLILLRQFEENHQLLRSLSIQKMRDSDFDTATRSLTIAKGGLVIGNPLSAGTSPPPLQPVDG
ncbi:MAG TPA: ATPase domain-containing protein [Rhodopila sp.]|jgi:circadian clock protein KaiC